MSPPHAPPMCSSFHTNRRISSVQPTTRRPGTIFNPPHFRARGGASWRDRRLTLTADLSYIGGVDDSRTVPASRVASMTTLDLTARYRTEGPGLTGGLDVPLGRSEERRGGQEGVSPCRSRGSPSQSTKK